MFWPEGPLKIEKNRGSSESLSESSFDDALNAIDQAIESSEEEARRAKETSDEVAEKGEEIKDTIEDTQSKTHTLRQRDSYFSL